MRKFLKIWISDLGYGMPGQQEKIVPFLAGLYSLDAQPFPPERIALTRLPSLPSMSPLFRLAIPQHRCP